MIDIPSFSVYVNLILHSIVHIPCFTLRSMTMKLLSLNLIWTTTVLFPFSLAETQGWQGRPAWTMVAWQALDCIRGLGGGFGLGVFVLWGAMYALLA